ncbi:MAG: hypothetical protein ACREX3_06785 [Gammaproteobacteria bacterium]
MDDTNDKALVVVATDREWEALRDIGSKHRLRMNPVPLPNLACWELGIAYGWRFYLVRSEMGTQGAGAATLVADEAIRRIQPRFVLMPGVAFGLQKDKQKLADLLVARWIIDYETCKVTPDNVFERGLRFEASVELLTKARLEASVTKRVQFGEIICGCKLVNSPMLARRALPSISRGDRR